MPSSEGPRLKLCVYKFFYSKKISGQNKFLVPEKISVKKQIFGQNFFGKINVFVQKNFFWSKFFVKSYFFRSKKNVGKKHFGSKRNLCLAKFESKNFLAPTNWVQKVWYMLTMG